MKHAFITLIAALAALPSPAAQMAENYEAAKSLVQDDGYILFAYADGWDTYSRQICEKWMESEAVQNAAGNAVIMRAPVPNINSEEQKAADKAYYGELTLPDAPSYPAIFLISKSGRHYATITGNFMRKATAKKVAKLIHERLSQLSKQEELLAQSEQAEGVAKAKLIGQASEVEHLLPIISPVPKMLKTLKELDPEDQSGYQRRFKKPIDIMGELLNIEKKESYKKAISTAEEMLKDPYYTTEQKQSLHAFIIGALHRHGSLHDTAEIQKHADAITELDPESVLGKSVHLVKREYCIDFSLAEGWNPTVLANTKKPLELKGKLPISSAGAYQVIFAHQQGRRSCSIRAVSLYDGKSLVGEDRHNAEVNRKNPRCIYRLQAPASVKEPHLFIEFDQSANLAPNGTADSYGSISIIRGE